MQDFPNIEEQEYRKARRQIHSIAKILGRFREMLVEPIAKNDNLWLSIVDKGFCTPPMSRLNDLEIGCSLEELVVEIGDNKDRFASISIKGKSASELSSGIKNILNDKFSIDAHVDTAGFDSTKAFNIEIKASKEFLIQFTNFTELLKEFWKQIAMNDGVKTQICLWPHNFDNAFKWFSGRKIDDNDEFMGIGFSNGDEMYELPYAYLTLSPPLRKTNTLVIPEGAYLHDSDWTGLVLPYEAIMEKKDIESQSALINNFFDESFAGIKKGFLKR
jgi:Family of unknown function (DUF5996)